MKCDNCIKNGVCQIKAQFLKMNPLGKIGSCYAFIEKDTDPKPITNADRIRAMSDEELAYWMTHLHEDGHCLNERCQIFLDKTCEECVIDWLKQPAEGASNG